MKLKARVFVKQEIINYLIYLPLTLLQLWTSWSQWLWQNNSTILFGEFACITIHYFKNLVMAFFYELVCRYFAPLMGPMQRLI